MDLSPLIVLLQISSKHCGKTERAKGVAGLAAGWENRKWGPGECGKVHTGRVLEERQIPDIASTSEMEAATRTTVVYENSCRCYCREADSGGL